LASEHAACESNASASRAAPASRRRVNAEDIAPPMQFYKQARDAKGDFDAGIRAGLARILAGTSFLYRIEQDATGAQAGTAHPVSDIELASRLSFFLWSSIPDQPL